jgi:hypothetical protein
MWIIEKFLFRQRVAAIFGSEAASMAKPRLLASAFGAQAHACIFWKSNTEHTHTGAPSADDDIYRRPTVLQARNTAMLG